MLGSAALTCGLAEPARWHAPATDLQLYLAILREKRDLAGIAELLASELAQKLFKVCRGRPASRPVVAADTVCGAYTGGAQPGRHGPPAGAAAGQEGAVPVGRRPPHRRGPPGGQRVRCHANGQHEHASGSSLLPACTYAALHCRADDWEVLTAYLDAFMHMNEDLRASDLPCVPVRPRAVPLLELRPNTTARSHATAAEATGRTTPSSTPRTTCASWPRRPSRRSGRCAGRSWRSWSCGRGWPTSLATCRRRTWRRCWCSTLTGSGPSYRATRTCARTSSACLRTPCRLCSPGCRRRWMARPRRYVGVGAPRDDRRLPDGWRPGLPLGVAPEQSSELDRLRGRCTLEQIRRFLCVPA